MPDAQPPSTSPSASPSDSSLTNTIRCRNCGTLAPGKYCPECGQETSLHPPSVREFVDHFLGNYVAVKSTLAQTLWALVSKPGQLTLDYLAGRKRRYVLPLKLYLTVSIISLLVISLFGNLGADAPPLQVKHDMNGTFLDVNGATIKYEQGKFVCTGLPDRACNHLRKRFDRSPEELRAAFVDVPQRMLKFWSYAMFVLIPLFALMLQLVYRNRRLVYGEHLVFALHLHTFWVIAIVALVVLPDAVPAVVGAMLFFAIPTYALRAMRRVYGGRWWPRWLRAALLSMGYWVLMLLMIVVVTGLALVL